MSPKSRQNEKIRQFIVKKIESYPKNIVTVTAEHFGITRMTANRYLLKLIADQILTASGVTKAREYKLNDFVHEIFDIPITQSIQEDVVWRKKILPLLEGVRNNIIDICHYGVTEMINNVIDHSGSKKCVIEVKRNAKKVSIKIIDFGIGIFEKIRLDCHLNDPQHALLELSKGKLTTDPKNHSGEGIFFTSRMFTEFAILSGKLFYQRTKKKGDWLIEREDRHKDKLGTCIELEIDTNNTYTTTDVFNQYTDDEFIFSQTHVPIQLARYGNEQLISRSQAKRVLTRVEKFSEVLLDFKNVQQIGQGFADEIFRVFRNQHPDIKIIILNTSPLIDAMIKHVQGNQSIK